MLSLINAQDILERGVYNLETLRPVLSSNATPEEAIAANATLRKDEWEMIDERVNEVFRERLTVVDDLRTRGLVESVSLGTLIRITERLNNFDAADISFDGDTDPTMDRPSFERDSVPVPVISKGFRVNWRQLISSRERGDSLDVTGAEQASRRVRDRLQELITNGLSVGGPQGGGIPGLTTAPNRLEVTIGTAWNASGADIIGDTENALETAYGANLFGPFVMYVPKNYWAVIQGDYSAQKGDRTFMERIMAFVDIEAVRPNDSLADNNVLLVQMTRDVIDLSEAQTITTVQWDKNPFVTNFRALTVAGPQIKSIEIDGTADTAAGSAQSTINGIVHLSV